MRQNGAGRYRRGAVAIGTALSVLATALATGCSDSSNSDTQPVSEAYTPAVTPAVYMVNFLFLYAANPELAAFMPAYRAPIPQALFNCLEKNPEGCPYDEYEASFDQVSSGGGSRSESCPWPTDCQEDLEWERLAPAEYQRPDQINEPLGMERAEELARRLGIDESMILTAAEYQCLIGTPMDRTPEQEIIADCIPDLTNSNGNPNGSPPLSSYGLYVDQGNVRSACSPGAPCLEFNELFLGPLEVLAARCGALEKLLRLVEATPFFQFAENGHQCQICAGVQEQGACIVETDCSPRD